MSNAARLKALEIWMAWRMATPRDREPFKMPLNARDGKPGSSTNAETWTTYDAAAKALEEHRDEWSGLAFALRHNVWVVDLDGCRPEGVIEPWAASIIKRLDSYTELSPSGRGVHVILMGDDSTMTGMKLTLDPDRRVELYKAWHYFTFTGLHVEGTPDDLQDRTEAFEALRADVEARRTSSASAHSARRAPERAEKPATAEDAPRGADALTDEELLALARSGPSGVAFSRLYDDGDMADYHDDHSAADMGLCGRLAFWCGKDPERMDTLFRKSALMRKKWDTRRGLGTYGEQTIQMAINNAGDFYEGKGTDSSGWLEKMKAKRAAKVAKTQTLGDTITPGHIREDISRGADKTAFKGHTVPDKPDSGTSMTHSRQAGLRAAEELSTATRDEVDLIASTETGRALVEELRARLSDAGSKTSGGHNGLAQSPADPDTSDGYVTSDIKRTAASLARVAKKVNISEPVLVNGAGDMIPDDEANASREGQVSLEDFRTSTPLDALMRGDDVSEPDAHDEGHPQAPALPGSEAITTNVEHGRERIADSIEDDREMLRLNDRKLTRMIRLKPRSIDPQWHPDFGNTDAGNGERFEALMTGQLIYSKTRGWLVYDKKRWGSGDEFAQRAAEDVAHTIYGESQDPALEPNEAKAMFTFAKASLNTPKLHAMLERASNRPTIFWHEEELDSNPFAFNAQNGTIDLMTGAMHAHTPDDYITKIAATDYDADAQSDLWLTFLETATRGQEGLAEFLQRAVGYSLTGDTREDKIFVLQGPGGTGKSTFVGAVRAMLGDYGRTMRSETLTERGGGGHNEDVAVLAGARFVLAVEADEQSKMREGLLKHLSGGDEMSASRKNRPVFTFSPQLKFWLATNSMPRLRSDDSGTWRRVLKCSFSHVPSKPDPTLRAKLRAPYHQRAILAWAVEGTRMWWADAVRGIPLRVPESVVEATEQMRRSMDGQAEFFAEYLQFGDVNILRSTFAEIMESYQDYCTEAGIAVTYRLGTVAMNRALQAHGATPVRIRVGSKQARAFNGVALRV